MFKRGVINKLEFNDDALGKSRTHQSFAKDADINVIMGRYQKTGLLVDPLRVNPHRKPNFGDFSDIGDLTTTMARIDLAREAFMVLPAKVRERFNNDAGELLAFVANPANAEEAIKLGLLPAPPAPPNVLPKDVPNVPAT